MSNGRATEQKSRVDHIRPGAEDDSPENPNANLPILKCETIHRV